MGKVHVYVGKVHIDEVLTRHTVCTVGLALKALPLPNPYPLVEA